MIYEHVFENSNYEEIQHDAGANVSVRVIVDGKKRSDYIRSICADSFDPLNRIHIRFTESISGRVQVYMEDFVPVSRIGADISTAASLLGFNPPYSAARYEYNKKTQDIAAAGYENGVIIHPSVIINYIYNTGRNKIISKQLILNDKNGNVISDRTFLINEEIVDAKTKIIHTYEVDQ